ncbi:hypothetical protein [Halorussus halophilus]|uniref:hypothetical protein n=1 Tax=Halorussus halophilus TaxID=2650975 RepID=UPI001300F0FE|nr:hypothetical protein [Halorussus halophilus]
MTRLKVATGVMALMLVFAGCAGSGGGGEAPANSSAGTSSRDMGGDRSRSNADSGMDEDAGEMDDTTTESMNSTTESTNTTSTNAST